MKSKENQNVLDRLREGLKYSVKKLVEDKKKQDGTLVISENGKIVRVKARDLK